MHICVNQVPIFLFYPFREQLTRLSFFDILVLIIVTIFILSGSDEYAKKIQQTKRIDQKFSEKPNRPSDCRYRLYLPSGTVSQHQPWHRISESYASEIQAVDGADHFDANTMRHHHFVCTKCQHIYDLEMDNIDSVLNVASAGCNGRIDDYRINFYGICEHCLSNEKDYAINE